MNDKVADGKIPEQALMQRALGAQWQQLPRGLQRHYQQRQDGSSHETGWLTITYPRWMQWPLNFISLTGGLLNKSGEQVPTEVSKFMTGERQQWRRIIRYSDGTEKGFDSYTVNSAEGDLTEYINALLGMRMRVHVAGDKLYYRSAGYVLKLGNFQLTIPEWLALGYGYIEETALDDERFTMNFWLQHPLLGEVYRYRGEFRIS